MPSTHLRLPTLAAAAVLLAAAAFPASAQVDPPPAEIRIAAASDPDERSLQEAAISVTDWARRLFESLSAWGSSIDRSKMIGRLEEVNRQIFAIRDRKSLLLSQLEADVISEQRVRAATDSLAERISALRRSVTEIGADLQQFPELDGDEVARALSDAGGARKLWLDRFQSAQAGRDSVLIRQLYADGRATVLVLDSTGAALGRLIARLKDPG